MERTSFAEVDAVETEFRLKNDLWNGLHEWAYKVVRWNESPFNAIDVENISNEVAYYDKIAKKCK